MDALGDIQTWRDADEQKVEAVRRVLTTAGDLPEDGTSRIYATHVVSGAVMEALANGADIPLIFDRMVNLLAKLHGQNRSGGHCWSGLQAISDVMSRICRTSEL